MDAPALHPRVGIRQFREKLSDYLESAKPVAITRHGVTIGFFVPAPRNRRQQEREALRAAGALLDRALGAAGLDADTLVADFRKARTRRS
jgi:antitoxin (DNA-binding transcriptional repressor) of toxin-antitoxin stability system